jgi:expansin (peptidoglycan-binding protein)
VDECPGCGLNHLDLFPDAFADLANPTTGVIDVTWDYVDCPITSALSVHNKEGVSAYWFSMQVVNANKAVASLDVSTDGGSTWQTTTRQTYNFFENSSGFGTTIVDVKITSVDGDVVIVNDVTVSGGTSTEASSNFGSSGTVGSTVAAIVSSTTSPSPVEPTTSTTPVSAPTTSETPVFDTTASYPGTNFAETSVSISPTPSTTPTTAVIPTSLAAADGGIVSTTIPPAAPVITEATPTPSSSTAPEVVTAFVDTCEA